MEENNGRTVEPVNGNFTIEELKEKYDALLKEATSMYNEFIELRQTWALQRTVFLFEVVKNDCFSTEFKMKAVDEIEQFLYPKEVSKESTEVKES